MVDNKKTPGPVSRLATRAARIVGRRPAPSPVPASPPVALTIAAETPDVWLVDLVGAEPSQVEALAGAVVAWRDGAASEAELILLVDPEAEEAARRTALSIIIAQSDDEAAAAVATVGVTRTVAVRDIPRIGTMAVTVEPTIVAEPRRPRTRPPIFVGGTGRSGTWAVGRLVGRHSAITTLHTELRFHSVPKGYRAVLRGQMTPDDFADQVLDKWYQPPGFSPHTKGLQLVVARSELVAALDRFRARAAHDLPRALRRLMRELIDPYALKRGARGWVETTPDNAAAAGALTKVFPGAKVVHMVRDGRDVAASVANLRWGPDTIEGGLEWWGRRMKEAQRGVAAADPKRVLTVRLEELVHFDRQATFGRLVEFLDVDDSQPVARYFETEVNADAGHLGRWRSQVSGEERHRIDGRYRELLAELAEVDANCLPIDPDRIDEAIVVT